jgi:DNA-binding PadR family transcriptional regulator
MWPFRFAMHGRRGLRMMVVTLLSSSPRNGVEIMDGVETMTRGWWRPTPGSVYPLLDKMTGEGTIRKREDGKYELTPKAKKEVEFSFGSRFRRPQAVGEVVSEIGSLVSYLEDVDSSGREGVGPYRETLKGLAERLRGLGAEDRRPAGANS